MVRFSIKRGLRLHKGVQEWIVMRRLMDGALRLETTDGEILVATEAEILLGCAEGSWQVDMAGLGGETLPDATIPRTLDTFSEAAQTDAERTQYYLNRLMQQGRFISSPSKLRPRIQAIAEEIGDKKPPSTIKMYRWYLRYKNNRGVIDMAPRYKNRGRQNQWSVKVEEVIQDAIDALYLQPQKFPAKVVWEETQRKLNELRLRNPDLREELKTPSMPTVYRRVRKLMRYTVDSARLGKAKADREYRAVLGQVKVDRIHERWEIDHTPLDLIVFDEESLMPHGRPWLTIAIDKYSRMIMGLYLGFGNPSAYSVLQCLRQAILPKDEVLRPYDHIDLPWPARGIPEVLVCDNGMELHSKALVAACRELNIQLQFCPAKKPEYKGSVERFFRTISQDLVHRLPGTTFSNIWQRGDYASEKLACIGFKTLSGLLYKWVVEIYHHQLHRGIGMPPVMKWEQGERERIIEYPASPELLSVIMGHTAERSLFHYGLELNGLKYNSPDLQALHRRYGKNLKLKLKFHEDNISCIHVFDPHAKVYVLVPAIDQEYTQGLTLDQHELIRLKLREEARDYMDWNQVLKKKQELQELIDAAVVHKKMGVRKKAAKLRHINTAYPSGITPKQSSIPEPEALSIPLANSEALPEFDVSEHMLYEQSDLNAQGGRKAH